MKIRILLSIAILTFLPLGCVKVVEHVPPPPAAAPAVVMRLTGPYDADIPKKFVDALQEAHRVSDWAIPYIFLDIGASFEAGEDEIRALHFYERAGGEFRKRGNAAGEGTVEIRSVLALLAFGRAGEAMERVTEKEEQWTAPPRVAFASYLRGRLLLGKGDYRGARDAFRRCLEQNLPFSGDFNLLLLRRDAERSYGVSVIENETVPWIAGQNCLPYPNAYVSETLRRNLEDGIANLSLGLIRNVELRAMKEGAFTPEPLSTIAETDVRTLLGLAEGVRGNWGEARRQLDRGAELAERAGRRASHVDNVFFQNLVCLLAQDGTEGPRAVHRLIGLADRFRFPFYRVWARFVLSRYEAASGETGRAVALLREAAEIVAEKRSSAAVDVMTGACRFDGQVLYETLVELLAHGGDAKGAFEMAEQAKFRQLANLLAGRLPGRNEGEENLLKSERALGKEILDVRRKLERCDSGREAHQILPALSDLEESHRDVLLAIRRQNEELHFFLAAEPMDPAALQGLLDDNTTLLSYFVTDRTLYAWTLSKDRVHLESIRMGRAEVRRLVGDYLEAISSRDRARISSLDHQVYDAFLKPVIPFVGGDRIGIVPHDSLVYLPFAAMNYRGRYLVDGFSLFSLPDAGALRYAAARKPVRGLRTLAFANPDLGAPERELIFAEAQAERIRRRLGNVEVYVGKEATEKRVRELFDRFDIVHFAVRGLFSAAAPLNSSLLLSPEKGDDGRLTALDIFRMRFTGRLVTLSDCDTELAENSTGVEIAAFHRAFLYAGAPSVLSTLWSVDERSTVAAMGLFYGEIKKGKAVDESLRTTQLEMIRRGYLPYTWAPFYIIGWYE
jgi:CHAT domain-containing protein